MSKEERIKYGKELEDALVYHLRKEGLFAERYKAENPKDDMIHGDIKITLKDRDLYIDAKRTSFVSKKSLQSFRGNYFMLSESGSLDPNEWWFILRETMVSYVSKITKWKTLPSGDEGTSINLDTFLYKTGFYDFVKENKNE